MMRTSPLQLTSPYRTSLSSLEVEVVSLVSDSVVSLDVSLVEVVSCVVVVSVTVVVSFVVSDVVSDVSPPSGSTLMIRNSFYR